MRPRFPHTREDVDRAVDGPFGLVVGDLDDGSILVLRRPRRAGQSWTLTHWADAARSRSLEERTFAEGAEARAAFLRAVGL